MSKKKKRQVYTLSEFLEAHGGLSRSHYYTLKRRGLNPVEMKVGCRRLISYEAAAAWRKQMEQR